MSIDPLLEAWGKQNPWEMTFPDGKTPNPYFDPTPKRHGTALTTQPVVPNFGRKLHSTQGEVQVDENTANVDPNPKRHGSLPVVIPPRTLHVA